MSTTSVDTNSVKPAALRELLSESPVNSHTHKAVSDIVRDLRIGPIERVLLWLSKTDYYVLSLSTYHTRLALASLGMMVVFTTLLAFSSSLYTLMTTVVSPDSPARWPMGLALALIYAFGIMVIDREIVGSISKKSLPVRFLFAICIAIAVSFPVKLKFFEGRIQMEVTRMVDENNVDKINRIDELKQLGEPERQEQRKLIEGRIQSYDKEIAVLDKEIEREAGVVECGPKCQQYRQQKEDLMSKRGDAESQLAALSQPHKLPDNARNEIARLEGEVKEEHRISYDFLTKWEALGRISKSQGDDYKVISTFIFLFFLLLELVPLALKWSLGKTEYHYYIEARNNLNNQKIISLSNAFIRKMQENPEVALDMPAEITDILAAHMEDEARPTDMRGLFETLSGKSGQDEPQPSTQNSADSGAVENQDQTDSAAVSKRRRPEGGEPTIKE